MSYVTSSDRHHGHDANDPGDQAEAEHRDNLGGEQHLFHDDDDDDDDDVLRSLLYKTTLCACPPGTARTLLSIFSQRMFSGDSIERV